jgi:hypothetical protein
MVEAQHIAATMKLVDSRDEQDLLETLLEFSKPSLPHGAESLHYLLATPFRYTPAQGGSRFRGATDPGVFYGAASLRTAGAELGYWRWKFLRDAVDMVQIEPVAHTAFQAEISTKTVDLEQSPFDIHADLWKHPTNYGPTQQFARVVRQAEVGGISYCSVRDSDPSWCFALLTAQGFASPKPYGEMQTWFLAVSSDEVTLRNGAESMHFSCRQWG